MNRILGILMILAAATLVVLNAEKIELIFADMPTQFRAQMQRDLQMLKDKNKLQAEFFTPRSVTYLAMTPFTRSLIYKNFPLESHNSKSPHRLEIELHEWEDHGELGVTVTFNVYQTKDDNKIDEFGRTYILIKPQPQAQKPNKKPS